MRVIDRDSRRRLYETPIGTRVHDGQPITRTGTRHCPGTLGGVQWNGPAWHPATQMLYVPSVDWCWTAKLDDTVRFVPGANYLGATFAPDPASSGSLTAIDAVTGRIRWQYRSPQPMVAAVTTTAGGLVLAGELSGDPLAFERRPVGSATGFIPAARWPAESSPTA